MDYTQEEQAVIWLCACTAAEPRERVELLRRAPSPEALFEEWERYCPGFREGGYKERRARLDGFLEELERKDYFAVTAVSADYPERLKAADPPLVLFGAGRRELLKERMFCIVGSRVTPAWAETLGERIAERLSRHFAIVSGLAEGGDLAAVKGALAGGKAVCVLPNGLDTCYPAAHTWLKEEVRRKGLLLSEYLPAETAKKYSFHARNRILAGISEGTLVLSAGEKSGALITAYDAAEYGRDVFAIPYNPTVAQGAGCNGLLKKGAYVCTGAQDILDAYSLFGEEERFSAELTEQEARARELLEQEGEMHTAVVAERMGIAVHEAAAILSSLELKGCAVKSGGNRYSGV